MLPPYEHLRGCPLAPDSICARAVSVQRGRRKRGPGPKAAVARCVAIPACSTAFGGPDSSKKACFATWGFCCSWRGLAVHVGVSRGSLPQGSLEVASDSAESLGEDSIAIIGSPTPMDPLPATPWSVTNLRHACTANCLTAIR